MSKRSGNNDTEGSTRTSNYVLDSHLQFETKASGLVKQLNDPRGITTRMGLASTGVQDPVTGRCRTYHDLLSVLVRQRSWTLDYLASCVRDHDPRQVRKML